MKKNIAATGHWLERLSALHRNQMRKFAAEEGLQFVHIEIMQYLSICNTYSDTTQGISEYLGQTKGSISQSLSYLEENNFVKRNQDQQDRRVFHLSLTAKGTQVVERMNSFMGLDEIGEIPPALQQMLLKLQVKNNHKGFGICRTCKFNMNPGKNIFVCGLTNEKLKLESLEKICREHDVALTS